MKMPQLVRTIVNTPKAPNPTAPISQAIIWDRTIYASGIIGVDKNTMKLVPGGTVVETRQALITLGHILESAGSSYEKVIKVTILLKNIEDFAAVNTVYQEFFKKDYPARTTYQVANLPFNASVEIEVIAGIGEITKLQSKL